MSVKIFVFFFLVLYFGVKFCMFYCKIVDLLIVKSEKIGGGFKKFGDWVKNLWFCKNIMWFNNLIYM